MTVKMVVPVLGSFDLTREGNTGMEAASSQRFSGGENFSRHIFILYGEMSLFAVSDKLFMLIFLAILFYFINPERSPDNSPVIIHDVWTELLKKHVTADGTVNYKALQNEKSKLQSYLDMLSKNPPNQNWQRNEIMAYWINTYNAFTVKLILDHYPLKSIQDLDNGKPWDNRFIRIGDKRFTLNDIEHENLRKNYGDARIHFAINCASRSCPKLLNEAYTPANLEQQLQQQAKSFVNNASKNKISVGKIEISRLFDWYKEDFTRNGTVIDFLNKYALVEILPDASVSYMDYDWSLNE